MHISLVIVNDIMWFTKQSFPNNSLKPAQMLFLVFRALSNSKVPLKLSDVQTQENRAGMVWLRDIYIYQRIYQSQQFQREVWMILSLWASLW